MNMMNNLLNSHKKLLNNTENFDVVLSSRVMLSRNLDGYNFPGKMDLRAKKETREEILEAFKQLPIESQFSILYMDNLQPINMRQIIEKNVECEELLPNEEEPVITNSDGSIVASLNQGDHLKLSCTFLGLSLEDAYKAVDKIDSELENSLHYACSLQWGYHCTSLLETGTGMKGAVILHLPALRISSLIDDIKSTFKAKSFIFQEVHKAKDGNPGDLYQVTNGFSYGLSEPELLEGLEDIIRPIINLERKTRNSIFTDNKVELENKVFRAYGILKYAKLISFKEALEHLSYLRMGICYGIIDYTTIEDVTPLFFLLQDYHIKKIVKSLNLGENGNNYLSKVRSKIIKDFMNKYDM